MGDLITQLTNLVSLRKTANISVPGLLIAIAVLCVMNANPPPKQTEPRVPPAPAIRASMANAVDAATLVQTCIDALKNPSAKSAPVSANGDVQAGTASTPATFVNCTTAIQARLIEVQAEQARLTAEIGANQKLVTDLTSKHSAMAQNFDPLAPAVWAERQAALAALNDENSRSKDEEATSTMLSSALNTLAPQTKDSAQSPTKTADAAADPVTTLINNVLNLLILGLLFGFVVDPIMAALQPPVYAKLAHWPHYQRTFARIDKHAKTVIQTSLRVTLADDAGVGGDPPTAELKTMTLTDFTYGLNYALGLGLIGETDLDGFRQRYLYPSQLLLNVAVALGCLWPALVAYAGGQRHGGRLYYWHVHPLWIIVAGVVYLACAHQMLVLAMRQYHGYRGGLQALIEGRRQKQRDVAKKIAAAAAKPKAE